MKRNNLPSREYIISVLKYDPSSKSCLRWIKSPANRVKVGAEAGYLKRDKRNGYDAWVVYLLGVSYQSSNVIYKLVYGESPKDGFVIDHINRISTDNRIENLRLIPVTGNNANRSLNKKLTTTGIIGVWFNEKTNRYYAYGNIPTYGRKYLGSYDNIQDAILSRICHVLTYYKDYCERELIYVKNNYPSIYSKVVKKFDIKDFC